LILAIALKYFLQSLFKLIESIDMA